MIPTYILVNKFTLSEAVFRKFKLFCPKCIQKRIHLIMLTFFNTTNSYYFLLLEAAILEKKGRSMLSLVEIDSIFFKKKFYMLKLYICIDRRTDRQ